MMPNTIYNNSQKLLQYREFKNFNIFMFQNAIFNLLFIFVIALMSPSKGKIIYVCLKTI